MKRKLVLMLIVMLAAVVLPANWAAVPVEAGPTAQNSFLLDEPNDTPETATPLDGGQAFARFFLSAADTDYYRLELANEVDLTVVISTTDYVPSLMAAEIAVFDAGHTLLAENVACNTLAELYDVHVPAGTVYVRARPCAGPVEIDTSYTMQLFWDDAAVETEPNDTVAAAGVMPMTPPYEFCEYCGGEINYLNGSIDPEGDIDLYRMETTASEMLSVELTPGAGSSPLALALLAADQTVLAEAASCWPGSSDLCLDATLDDAATYYLRVRSATHPLAGGDYKMYAAFVGEVADEEPNDTPAQARGIGYGARISVEPGVGGDDDYYTFTAAAGDKIRFVEHYGYGDRLSYWSENVEIELFDPSMNPVPLDGDLINRAVLPAGGLYTVKITLYDEVEDYESYIVNVGRDEGDEPNDTLETASPIQFGPQMELLFDYPCDVDWLWFEGRAGDVVRFVNSSMIHENVFLYDANGQHITSPLPSDGVYYLKTEGYFSDKWDTFCYSGRETHPFGEALWVSSSAKGLGGGSAIQPGDIATRKNAPGQWQIVFDASDVGIVNNVNAFERLPNGTILLSLAAAQRVPGLGKVMPHDIIRFVPTSLGDDTAGTFEWFLDGSDVGLSTAGEKIDAIYMQEDIQNPLRISTTGAGAVPRESGGTLKFADEDVINLVGGVFGVDSAGKWRLSLDGSTVPGLKKEDVSNLARLDTHLGRDAVTLVGLDSAFVVQGTHGTPRDVLNMDTWQTAVAQLANVKIDGLAVGPAWMP